MLLLKNFFSGKGDNEENEDENSDDLIILSQHSQDFPKYWRERINKWIYDESKGNMEDDDEEEHLGFPIKPTYGSYTDESSLNTVKLSDAEIKPVYNIMLYLVFKSLKCYSLLANRVESNEEGKEDFISETSSLMESVISDAYDDEDDKIGKTGVLMIIIQDDEVKVDSNDENGNPERAAEKLCNPTNYQVFLNQILSKKKKILNEKFKEEYKKKRFTAVACEYIPCSEFDLPAICPIAIVNRK